MNHSILMLGSLTLLAASPAFAQAGNPNAMPWTQQNAMGDLQKQIDIRTIRNGEFKSSDYKLSPTELTTLREFERRLNSSDADTAMAAAEAAAKSNDAHYVLGALEQKLADKRKDAALREKAFDHLAASGKVPADALPALYKEQGLSALARNDNAKAELAFAKLVEVTPGVPETRVILGQVRANQGKNGEALAMFDEAIRLKQKASEPVPETWVAVSSQLRAKVAPAKP